VLTRFEGIESTMDDSPHTPFKERPDVTDATMPGSYVDPVTETDYSVTSLDGMRGFNKLWWERRRWLIPALSVALLALILFTTTAIIVRSRQPYLTFGLVTQGNMVLTFQTTGTLRSAVYGADFAVTGTVAQVNVTVGQQVAQGDTLAQLNPTLLQDAVTQAQVALDGASTALSSTQTNQDKVQASANALTDSAYNTEQAAIAQCNRLSSPPPSCVAQARSQYAASLAAADSMNAQAQQQTDAAQAQYNSAKAALQGAQDNLGAATLKAPHGGTVAAINGSVGQTSGGTKSSGAPFIQIADLNALQITAMVNETQVGVVLPQDAVRFTVPSFKNRVFSGSVSGVSPFGQTTRTTVLYPMTVDVDSQSVSSGTANTPGQVLLPGMTAKVTVLTAQRFAVKLIPNSAVTYAHFAADPRHSTLISKAAATKALAQAQQMLTQLQNSSTDYSLDNPTPAYVLVRVKGIWTPQPVVLGLTNGAHYEVLSGLNLGDKVATGEQSNWIVILRNQ
jgi:multidrug efflux pump subunit AcrA (membrane-fusion protein)